MIKVVSWNINENKKIKRTNSNSKPWYELNQMAAKGDVDLALLQEVPDKLIDRDSGVPRDFDLYDRWPLVVELSDRVEVDRFKQVPPIRDLAADAIGVSGIGTIAAAKVTPVDGDREGEPFIAVSMYGRWLKPHPSTKSGWSVGYSDASAHRIISDLSAFIGHENSSRHRILAAGDLNILYGYGEKGDGYATGRYWKKRYWNVFKRMQALGLEFLGPQHPNGRQADPWPDELPCESKNVPTYFTSRQSPKTATRQLDYVFASRGFHESVKVRALNEVDNWGSSDHCRLLIEVDCG